MEKDDRYPDAWYNDSTDFDPFILTKCPKFPEHQRGTRDVSVNLWIDVKGEKVGDFVATAYSDWLITDEVAALLREEKLTGYELRPVKVCDRKLDFNLWEMAVTGSAGKAHSDAGIRVVSHCAHCGSTVYSPIKKGVGIVLNEETWDGSDFFTIDEYYKYILVTENVKRVIEGNKLKGVRLVPISALGWEE